MALSVPAIAWIENSALIVVVIFAMMLAVGAVVWWHWRRNAPAAPG
jgi:flagellar basal body-associated protein FliL